MKFFKTWKTSFITWRDCSLLQRRKEKSKYSNLCNHTHLKMRQFQKKNPPKIENYLKWPSFRAKIKRSNFFFLKPSCLLICTRKTIYKKSKIFLYEIWLFWQITSLVVNWTGLRYFLIKNEHYLYFSIDKQSLTFCCKYNHFFYLVFPRFETYL